MERLKNNIQALKTAIRLADQTADMRKAQLRYLEQHGKILQEELNCQRQSIASFDNQSFYQSLALGRSRLTSGLRNSQLHASRLTQTAKSRALPTVEKQELDELQKRLDQLSHSYHQKSIHIDDPVLRRLEENLRKETAQLESAINEHLVLYEKEQRLSMMKEALSKNLPLLSRKKDSIPADFEEQSVNRMVVRRGYTTKMMHTSKHT